MALFPFQCVWVFQQSCAEFDLFNDYINKVGPGWRPTGHMGNIQDVSQYLCDLERWGRGPCGCATVLEGGLFACLVKP
jgi:hypothetical protein